jgi:cytochrome P450
VQAASGLTSEYLTADDDPTRQGLGVVDAFSGFTAVAAILAALLDRERTGRGTRLDVAMLDAALALLSARVAEAVNEDNRQPALPASGRFSARDRQIYVSAAHEKWFRGLCEVLGAPELAADDRFATPEQRLRHRDDLHRLLEARFRTRDAEAWQRELNAIGIPASVVRTLAEGARQPQAQHRKLLHEVDSPRGRIAVMGSPFALPDHDRGPRTPRVPELGEHTNEVLRELRAPEWDPFAPEALADPPRSWTELRERCPVAWSKRQGGFWAVSRYDDVVDIARGPDLFNNSGGPQFGTPRPPLEVDRPLHAAFRRALQPYFHHERLAALAPRVRGFTAEMLEPVLEAGGGDLAPALTYPLPVRTLCAWLGLPDTEWAYLKGLADELFQAEEGRGNDPETRERKNQELYAYSRRLVRERVERPLDPKLDLISGLLRTVAEGDVVQVVRLLIVAGHNSTTSALGNCLLRIAGDESVQRRLRNEPELIETAVEEFLRLETPVQAMPRWANEETELHGRQIRAGDQLMLLWASANRDPSHFADPGRCVLERSPNPQLAFGYGIHKCIGADLARLELRVACEELLARTAWIELAGEPSRTSFIRLGVSALPVRIQPRG